MRFESKLSLLNRFFICSCNGSIKYSGDEWIILKYTNQLIMVYINLSVAYKTQKWVTYLIHCHNSYNNIQILVYQLLYCRESRCKWFVDGFPEKRLFYFTAFQMQWVDASNIFLK